MACWKKKPNPPPFPWYNKVWPSASTGLPKCSVQGGKIRTARDPALPPDLWFTLGIYKLISTASLSYFKSHTTCLSSLKVQRTRLQNKLPLKIHPTVFPHCFERTCHRLGWKWAEILDHHGTNIASRFHAATCLIDFIFSSYSCKLFRNVPFCAASE